MKSILKCLAGIPVSQFSYFDKTSNIVGNYRDWKKGKNKPVINFDDLVIINS